MASVIDPDDFNLDEFRSLDSFHLSSVRYYRGFEVLLVEFTDGSIWRYDGVEWGVYLGLLKASSHGEYFADMIRLEYPYEQVG